MRSPWYIPPVEQGQGGDMLGKKAPGTHGRPYSHTLPVGSNGDSTLWEGLVLP